VRAELTWPSAGGEGWLRAKVKGIMALGGRFKESSGDLKERFERILLQVGPRISLRPPVLTSAPRPSTVSELHMLT
jgi:hypothetical protein